MNRFILLFLILVPAVSWAFILINPDYRLADPKNTRVNIAAETCPAVGVSNEILKSAIEISIEKFWNTATESQLHMKMGDIVSRTDYASLVPGEILVGCAASSPGNGGVTRNDRSKGAAVIDLDADIMAAGFDRIVGVVVHEMGHGVGLNHSADPASVMTYEDHDWGLRPSALSQDDKDGVVYLYPSEGEAGGLIPGCSANASQSDRPSHFALWGMLVELLGIFLIFMVLRAIDQIFGRWILARRTYSGRSKFDR